MIHDMYFLSYFWYDIFPYILTTIQSRPNYIIQIIDKILVEKTIMNLKLISRGVPVARLKPTGYALSSWHPPFSSYLSFLRL
jgi:hypothetical protein